MGSGKLIKEQSSPEEVTFKLRTERLIESSRQTRNEEHSRGENSGYKGLAVGRRSGGSRKEASTSGVK